MLAGLCKEHQGKQASLAAENERRRKDVLGSVPKVAGTLVSEVNTSVAKIFHNQRRIEHEMRQIEVQSKRFTAQAKLWLDAIDTFNYAVKVCRICSSLLLQIAAPTCNNVSPLLQQELGDFEMYAGVVEGDMRTVVRRC